MDTEALQILASYIQKKIVYPVMHNQGLWGYVRGSNTHEGRRLLHETHTKDGMKPSFVRCVEKDSLIVNELKRL